MRNKTVTRFTVFRALQSFMDRHGYCPSASEIARRTCLSVGAVSRHMHALDGADGLSCPVVVTRSHGADRHHWADEGSGANPHAGNARDPWRSPVDRLMA